MSLSRKNKKKSKTIDKAVKIIYKMSTVLTNMLVNFVDKTVNLMYNNGVIKQGEHIW